jgi:hypothetical protein
MNAFARSVANPDAIASLFQLLVTASPKIKHQVISILQSLVKMKLPFELFETGLQIAEKSTAQISQLFQKSQPTIRFKNFRFLSLIYLYASSIRQKVWIKQAFESIGMYEVSSALFRLLGRIYENSEKHPWRIEMQDVL